MIIRIFMSLLFTFIGIFVGLNKLVAQSTLHPNGQKNLCLDLTLDVLMPFSEIGNNRLTQHLSLLFQLRSTQPISQEAHGNSMDSNGHFIVEEVSREIVFARYASPFVIRRSVEDAVRIGFDQLKIALEDYYDHPSGVGTVTNITSGKSVIIQGNFEEGLIEGDIFNIFPIHNNPCHPTYISDDNPEVIARAVLIDQGEHSSTLQIIGSRDSASIQVGNLVRLSGGNIYNRGSSHYKYGKINGKKSLKLNLTERFVLSLPGRELDTTTFIFDTILKVAGDFELDMLPVENALYPLYQEIIGNRLFECIENNDLRCVELIIEAGGNLNVRNEYGETPIVHAIIHSDPEGIFIKTLLNANVDIEAHIGPSLLIYTSDLCNPDVTSMLIDAGVDVNAATQGGRTPLSISVISVNVAITSSSYSKKETTACVEVVRILLEAGANVDVLTLHDLSVLRGLNLNL